MRTSKNYIMTVDPLSVTDIEKLILVKRTIAKNNRLGRLSNRYTPSRVVVRGRVPASKGSSQYSYDRFGNVLGGIHNAERWDIYVYAR